MRTAWTTTPARVGLCLSCAHCRVVTSSRGPVFYLCERSTTDPAFPRYPALPVLSCHGYEDRPAREHET